MEIREFWVNTMNQIVEPWLTSMAKDKLKEKLPLKYSQEVKGQELLTYLQGLARIASGMAPWFNAENITVEEQEKQTYYLGLLHKALMHAADYDYKDYVFNFNEKEAVDGQLIEEAFLALAFIRCKDRLWNKLDKMTKGWLIYYFKQRGKIIATRFNGIFFNAIIEAFLYSVDEEYNLVVIDAAIRESDTWYTGNGIYKSNEKFWLEEEDGNILYPMLQAILDVIEPIYPRTTYYKDKIMQRAKLYVANKMSELIEKDKINEEPLSAEYRTGLFHCIADMSYRGILPEGIEMQRVRDVLTSQISQMLCNPWTVDGKGWLNNGCYGEPLPSHRNAVPTGSLYTCINVFLPLGLNSHSEFWMEE